MPLEDSIMLLATCYVCLSSLVPKHEALPHHVILPGGVTLPQAQVIFQPEPPKPYLKNTSTFHKLTVQWTKADWNIITSHFVGTVYPEVLGQRALSNCRCPLWPLWEWIGAFSLYFKGLKIWQLNQCLTIKCKENDRKSDRQIKE